MGGGAEVEGAEVAMIQLITVAMGKSYMTDGGEQFLHCRSWVLSTRNGI